MGGNHLRLARISWSMPARPRRDGATRRAAPARFPWSAPVLPGIDAYLWVKQPGDSDGPCNGGLPAGVYWPQYAVALAEAWQRLPRG